MSEGKKFRTRANLRFSDFDLQGVLNSRQYVDLVAEARIEQMRDCYQYPMDLFIQRGHTFVLSQFQIEFIRPIPFGLNVEVETTVSSVDGPIANIDFSFLSSNGAKIHAKGSVKYALFDIKNLKTVSFTPEDKAAFL